MTEGLNEQGNWSKGLLAQVQQNRSKRKIAPTDRLFFLVFFFIFSFIFSFVFCFVFCVCEFATTGRTFVETALLALCDACLTAVFRSGDFTATAADGLGIGIVNFDVDAAQRGALDAGAVAAFLTVGIAGVLLIFREICPTGEAE